MFGLSIFKIAPYIVIVLLIVGVYAGASTVVKDWKASIYRDGLAAGVDQERSRQEAIAQKVEAALVPRLDAIDAKAGRQVIVQHDREQPSADRIAAAIVADPHYRDCSVSQSVLDDRNAIRASLIGPAP